MSVLNKAEGEMPDQQHQLITINTSSEPDLSVTNRELFTKWLKSTLSDDERKIVSGALKNDPTGTLSTMINEHKVRAGNALNIDSAAMAESIIYDMQVTDDDLRLFTAGKLPDDSPKLKIIEDDLAAHPKDGVVARYLKEFEQFGEDLVGDVGFKKTVFEVPRKTSKKISKTKKD